MSESGSDSKSGAQAGAEGNVWTDERFEQMKHALESPTPEWVAKRRWAEAARSVMDRLAATDLEAGEIDAATEALEAFAGRIDASGVLPVPDADAGSLHGRMANFHHRSPLVGDANPIAPPLRLERDVEAREVRGRVRFGNAYEGAPGCVHGGFVAAVFDEALGLSTGFSGAPGMTGEFTTRYLRPTPTNTDLELVARFDRLEGRKIHNHAELHHGDTLIARATGIFITIPADKFHQLDAARVEREEQG